MTSSAPASIPEQIGALNDRINALEQELQAFKSSAPPPPAYDVDEFALFKQQVEARISNALNHMQAQSQRDRTALALLQRGGTP